ncbi:MAG: hypothetical protein EZS28_009609 [Streblomastix strix]|uniref:Pre-mRNA-splicing factor SYF2 n=1 Tax=Streblomastix strix TaxID=222440 RepID=A0A5J4WKJ3_9EUKA|nr:MAG: hypothetical protein EZS28_009609 [Streblomastix strix]
MIATVVSNPEEIELSSEEEIEEQQEEQQEEKEEKIQEEVGAQKGMQKKLFDLRLKMNEARAKNREEIVQEEKEKQMPFWKKEKIRKTKEKIEKEEKKEEIKAKGDEPTPDYMNETVDIALMEKKKRKRKEKHGELDHYVRGFVNPEASERAFKKRVDNIDSEQESFEKRKRIRYSSSPGKGSDNINAITPFFIPQTQSKPKLTPSGVPKEKVEFLQNQLAKDKEKKSTFHRHRKNFDVLETVDYIHEGNRKFNKRLEKAYEEYTYEIKENLERGTAL